MMDRYIISDYKPGDAVRTRNEQSHKHNNHVSSKRQLKQSSMQRKSTRRS